VAKEKGKGKATESNAIAIPKQKTPLYWFPINKGAIGTVEVNQIKALVLNVLNYGMTPRQAPIWNWNRQLAIATNCPDSLRLKQGLCFPIY
jgi:hypothetical protein